MVKVKICGVTSAEDAWKAVEYGAGARYGFPAMLALVIIVLIWRPYGVFGRADVTRV